MILKVMNLNGKPDERKKKSIILICSVWPVYGIMTLWNSSSSAVALIIATFVFIQQRTRLFNLIAIDMWSSFLAIIMTRLEGSGRRLDRLEAGGLGDLEKTK